MNPYYQDDWVTIYCSDCREAMLSTPQGSAIVTDPPYELGFMGKSWDSKGISFQKETWEVIRKSCLSGAPLLSFGGTRTFHRIACAIEDAGWEIRDTLAWVYGQGFPKSLDISKAIDYDACREQLTERLGRKPTKDELKAEWDNFRAVTGHKTCGYQVSISKSRKEQGYRPNLTNATEEVDITAPATPEAQLWEGYGTALKPAYEPIILAMNPLDGTFANNALKHGVAGLNIDGARIGRQDGDRFEYGRDRELPHANTTNSLGKFGKVTPYDSSQGRFPANFIHDGSQEVTELFPSSRDGVATNRNRQPELYNKVYGKGRRNDGRDMGYGGSGSAARFFYCAKASKAERDRGCEGLEPQAKCEIDKMGGAKCTIKTGSGNERNVSYHNNHPTVKPLALMEYLVKLVKMPEYNLIIDPFMGSGTTLLACIRLGIPCIGIDNDEKTCEIATLRCCQMASEVWGEC